MIPAAVIERLRTADNVVVLTGAGVSAESGVATFRDPDGLWAKFRPEELASMNGFLANPERVREWYAHRLHVVDTVKPNAGHYALAKLETLVPRFTLITQNVDRLHQRAGSVKVLEVHGNLVENRCNDCGWLDDAHNAVLQCTQCFGPMRPNVVWFGEDLPHDVWIEAETASRRADIMFSIGTSAQVYPAAGLPYLAKDHGAFVVEVNPDVTDLTPYAHAHLRGASGVILPMLIAELTS